MGEQLRPPIIIIGAARSGTKFLRDVMASGRGTAAVPYDVNYVWRYGNNRLADDCLDPDTLTADKLDFIRTALSRLARLSSGDQLVEKTVSNTLRVPFVSAVFPEARFVHLIRDGRAVTESAMRMWQAPPNPRALFRKLVELPPGNIGYAVWFLRNALAGLFSGRRGGRVWGPRYPGIDEDAQTKPLVEVCALQWHHSVSYSLRDLAQLPDDRVLEIRYEDLVSNPDAIVALVRTLDLPDRDAVIGAYEAKVKMERTERWRALPGEQRALMERTLEPTLRELGYKT